MFFRGLSKQKPETDARYLAEMEQFAIFARQEFQQPFEEDTIDFKPSEMDFAPAFLLGAARWQVFKERDAGNLVPMALSFLDDLARGTVGLEAYVKAVSAVAVYFALARRWRMASNRLVDM